jgi:hypothetical protein
MSLGGTLRVGHKISKELFYQGAEEILKSHYDGTAPKDHEFMRVGNIGNANIFCPEWDPTSVIYEKIPEASEGKLKIYFERLKNTRVV